MSMCRVFFCVVGRGCLLWPVRSLGKTLLAFVLLHSVLQGQQFCLKKGRNVLATRGICELLHPICPSSKYWSHILRHKALDLSHPNLKKQKSTHLGSTYTKTGTIQRSAQTPYKDDLWRLPYLLKYLFLIDKSSILLRVKQWSNKKKQGCGSAHSCFFAFPPSPCHFSGDCQFYTLSPDSLVLL